MKPQTHRRDRRDPRLPLARLVDRDVARQLWESLPEPCRRDHFDTESLPAAFRDHVRNRSIPTRPDWTSKALNARGLPDVMTWESIWLIQREIELGRTVDPLRFNCTTRTLRAVTQHGSERARQAESLLSLSVDEWLDEGRRMKLKGVKLGKSNLEHAQSGIRRWQDLLVYEYPHGEWWRLDVWNPSMDRRVPQRKHEPNGRYVANFSHLTDPWLREAAKWWLSVFLENETYTWSTVKTRLDGLK